MKGFAFQALSTVSHIADYELMSAKRVEEFARVCSVALRTAAYALMPRYEEHDTNDNSPKAD